MIKLIIKKIFNFFGYKIIKYKSDNADLNYITRILQKKDEPIIFDVGANKGQSIIRYKKIFPNSLIHSFEPDKNETEKLITRYKNDNSITLVNAGLGEKDGNLEFNINAISTHSSFKNLIPNTTWIKKRSKHAGVESKKYTTEKVYTKIITLDDYAEKKNIDTIDILKIDTQGYENKVLEGANQLLKKNKIKIIQLELIFSEIYENPLAIFDVEKFLIPNNYKLFATSNGGNLILDYIFQVDHIYVSADTYEDFKDNKSPFFNN